MMALLLGWAVLRNGHSNVMIQASYTSPMSRKRNLNRQKKKKYSKTLDIALIPCTQYWKNTWLYVILVGHIYVCVYRYT